MTGMGAWVPPDVLVAVLTLALAALYKLVLDRARKTELKLEEISRLVADLDKRFISSATIEQLGRMGERFDGRITTLAQDIAVMKAVSGK